MELSPGVVILAAVAAAAVFVLLRSRRNEAAGPVDRPVVTSARSAVAGKNQGGDNALVDWLLERASEKTGVHVSDDVVVRQRMAEAAAKAMEQLRSGGSAYVNLPFLVADARGPQHFEIRFQKAADASFVEQA